jgi:branched-chain amino acid transport system ATP-binding protein
MPTPVARNDLILQARAVSVRFGGVRALDSVDVSVRDGEILGIMGPNGSGKTTLFNAITGVERTQGGSIRFGDLELTRMAPYRIARLGVVRTFQNLRLFPNMTTTENVLCGAHMRQSASVLRALLPSPRGAAQEATERRRAIALLQEVGLADRVDAYASDLSYGQTKRLELARALNAGPRLLLLDEPAAGLNDAQAAVLLGLVRDLCRRRHLTLIVIEHNVAALVWLADRIVVLDAGRVLADAAPEVAASDPAVIEAYLGHAAVAAAS